MRPLLSLLLLVLLTLPAVAETAPKPPTAKEASAAIEAFLKDPLGAKAREQAGIIVAFAEASDAVMLQLSEKNIPWISEESNQGGPVLLAAYIAGNVRSQLKKGKPVDDPLAGWAAVFSVYDKIKHRMPDYQSPGVEKLLKLKAEGKLAAYAKG